MFKLKLLYKKIKELFEIYFQRKNISFDKNKKYVFVMLAADYNNLGDIAITVTQIKYLKDCLENDNYQIINIPVGDTCKVYLSMKKNIKKDSIITLIGGGNNGDLYEFIEKQRRFIIKKFKSQKIISFPQTVHYSDSKNGEKYLNEFKKLCKKCSNLTLMAREKKSYDFYKDNFLHNRILLAPDIVLYNVINNTKKRKGVSLIFRDDKEKLIDKKFEKDIEKLLINKDYKLSHDDTCTFKSRQTNEYTLKEYLNIISSKELIITDRLHGMIFCYITKTPCIVFDNNNGKIKNTYDLWLKNQNYIEYCDNASIEKINYIIDNLKIIVPKNDPKLIEQYAQIEKVIKE